MSDCELVDIDVKNEKLHLKCEGLEKDIDLEKSDCKVLQQGKNPPETVMVRCK